MPLRFADTAAETYRFPLTVGHLLDGVITKAADQQIIYRNQAVLSYRELVGRIGRLANMLDSVGAQQGMTIAVLDWDSHRYLEAYFAIPMMGCVIQTVNVRMAPRQIAYTLDHAEAKILLVHKDFFPIVEAIRAGLPRLKAVIAIIDEVGIELPEWVNGEYEDLSAAASPDYPFVDFDENALATTFYTSGTTGDPKGVCFTHRQLVLHTLVQAGAFGASEASPGIGVGDVYMPLTPMFHVHAWGAPYVATMLGVKQVYPGRYEPAMICWLREEHRVSYSHCVPTILEMIIQEADGLGADLSGWKMTIGGAALTRTLCAKARARGMNVSTGYGMSESCPLVAKAGRRFSEASSDEGAIISELTAAGISPPLVSIRIVDDAMDDVPHDGRSRGELVVRAPWLTPCYTGDPSSSQALWRGGWLHTQDIATIDMHGNLQIRDRLKDVIKSGGEWIDSIQLEELVANADGVSEASVVAVPDAKWGERPLAIIVSEAGKVLSLDIINKPVDAAIARNEITRYARIDRFEIVDQLPRTSVGKIDKKLLRSRFAESDEQVEATM